MGTVTRASTPSGHIPGRASGSVGSSLLYICLPHASSRLPIGSHSFFS